MPIKGRSSALKTCVAVVFLVAVLPSSSRYLNVWPSHRTLFLFHLSALVLVVADFHLRSPHALLPFVLLSHGFVHSRLSTGCKHKDLFTREEQARAFSASYKKVPVHTTTLRSLGNFKDAILPDVHKIPGISKPRAFQLLKDGDQVTVGMKEYMHHDVFSGMPRSGVFEGKPHNLFIGSVPRVEDAPPFELKALDEGILEKIQQRYDSVHGRLESLFPDGESMDNFLALESDDC